MTREQLKKHLELEQKFGPGFLPGAVTPNAERSTPNVEPDSEWAAYEAEMLKCTKCRLSETRTQVVIG